VVLIVLKITRDGLTFRKKAVHDRATAPSISFSIRLKIILLSYPGNNFLNSQ
jgi:hypothetical protein